MVKQIFVDQNNIFVLDQVHIEERSALSGFIYFYQTMTIQTVS